MGHLLSQWPLQLDWEVPLLYMWQYLFATLCYFMKYVHDWAIIVHCCLPNLDLMHVLDYWNVKEDLATIIFHERGEFGAMINLHCSELLAFLYHSACTKYKRIFKTVLHTTSTSTFRKYWKCAQRSSASISVTTWIHHTHHTQIS